MNADRLRDWRFQPAFGATRGRSSLRALWDAVRYGVAEYDRHLGGASASTRRDKTSATRTRSGDPEHFCRSVSDAAFGHARADSGGREILVARADVVQRCESMRWLRPRCRHPGELGAPAAGVDLTLPHGPSAAGSPRICDTSGGSCFRLVLATETRKRSRSYSAALAAGLASGGYIRSKACSVQMYST